MPSEGWLVAHDNIPAVDREFVVQNLQPARTYQFTVSAVNSVGEGSASKPSQLVELPQQRMIYSHFYTRDH